ncbi:MAG: peptidase C13 [Dokdonella sp.]|nr:MAG: peptidase C13 [Dokdonella sp.]
MPLRLGRSLFGALLAFVVSGAAWWWLPSAALVDTRVVATPAPADAPPALPAPVSAPQPATDEPDFDPEQVMYAQAALLDAELARLAPRTPGKINLYVVAFAGDAGEDVFHNEVEYVRTLFEQRFDAAGHVVVLQNNPRTLERAPLASWTSLHASLQAIAQRADPAQDIVLLYLTSHGSDDHELLVQMDPLPLVQLYPEDVADAFRTQPALRWRVVIVNACYSGGFIEALRDDSTLVMTSARRDRTSFGCGSDADITWFGKALLVDALNRTTSLPEAFALARDWVAQREAADPAADGTVEHSEPQLATSPSIEARLARWSAALPPRPPVEFKPAARR